MISREATTITITGTHVVPQVSEAAVASPPDQVYEINEDEDGDRNGDGNGGIVSNIVDQVAAGEISREHAISGIKANVLSYSVDVDEDNYNSGHEDNNSSNNNYGDNNNNNNSNYINISQQQKREMLFQKKKFGEHSNNAEFSVSTVIGGSTDIDANGDDSLLFSQDQDRFEEDYDYDLNGNEDDRDGNGNGGGRGGDDDGGYNRSQNRSNSAGRRSMQNFEYSRNSNRDNRAFQYENSIRMDMFRECTFKPKIKQLPQSLYPQARKPEGDFFDRVVQWQDRKNRDASSRKTINEEKKLNGCTWQPKICEESAKVVQRNRSNDIAASNAPIGERLYKHAAKSNIMKKELVETFSKLNYEKEKQACTFKPDLSANRGVFSEVGAKHLFTKPRLNSLATGASPLRSYQELSEKEKKECTFSPKVNKIGRRMESAKVYLKENVVNRLARTLSPDDRSQRSAASSRKSIATSATNNINNSNYDDKSIGDVSLNSFSDKPAIDVAAFLRSKAKSSQKITGKRHPNAPVSRKLPDSSPVRSIRPSSAGNALKLANSYRTPVGSRAGSPESSRSRGRSTDRSVRSSGGGGLRSYSAPRERTMAACVYSKSEMEERFSSFIQRQRNSLATWDNQLKIREKQFTPSFKPKLETQLSYEDNTETSAEFLQRVEADILKRSERKGRIIKILDEKIEQQKTLTPSITRYAVDSHIKPKYFEGITKEDIDLKRRKKQQEQEKYIERMNCDVTTFHPNISKLAMSKESQLAKDIASGTGKFLEKYKEKRNGLSDAQFQAQLQREEEDLKECTFAPRHSVLPGYIKRMADSLKIIRGFQRDNEGSNSESSVHMERWKS